jgi:hypothetical protein
MGNLGPIIIDMTDAAVPFGSVVTVVNHRNNATAQSRQITSSTPRSASNGSL